MPMKIRNQKLYHDRTIQNWHRATLPENCQAIDLDLIGMCEICRAWLYLIEGATHWNKPTAALRWGARKLGIPAFLIVGRNDVLEGGRLLVPRYKVYTPDELAEALIAIRGHHHRKCR